MPLDSIFKPITILLVEDSVTDALMTQEALHDAGLVNTTYTVEDGVEALLYLRHQGQYRTAIRPDLILLDLNLPRKSGHEVLAEIKADPELKSIPVVVLTTSDAAQDVLQAYDLYANCYVVKPVEFPDFAMAMQSIRQFWFRVATLPSEVDHV